MQKKFSKLIPGTISRMQKYKKKLEAQGHEVMVFETGLYYQLYW
jgi:hypothetical protein